MSPSKTQKSQGNFSFRGDGTVSILNAITKEEHAPRRRLLSRAFSIAALQEYEPLVVRTARYFCDSLLEHSEDSAKDTQGRPSHNIGTLSKLEFQDDDCRPR
jgi:cytochrome P450